MTPSTLPHINLIPQPYLQSRQRRIWISRWSAMVVATTVLVGLPGLYIGGSAVLTDSGMHSQIQTARTDLARHQQAIPQLRQQMQQLNAQHEVLELVKDRIEWRDVFTVLANAAGDDVRFSALSATGGGIDGTTPVEITVRGLAPTQTIAREYVVRLESLKLFDRVELIGTSRRSISSTDLVGFELRISVRGKGAAATMTQGATNAG